MEFMYVFTISIALFLECVQSFDGCLFDGKMYHTGDIMTIPKCLGEMTCLGNYNLSPIRPATHGDCRIAREVDGQNGCFFDGRVYGNGDSIRIRGCLGELTCLGHNNYSPIRPAPLDCKNTRDVNGQSGCLFDGRIYSPGDKIIIAKCLGEMTCLGNNNYGNLSTLGGECPDS